MGYEYLVLSALANALALSILSSYFYAEKYMKWKNDLYRFLAFVFWAIVCWLIPAFLFFNIFKLPKSYQIHGTKIFIILLVWIIPVLLIEIIYYKKGYFEREKHPSAD